MKNTKAKFFTDICVKNKLFCGATYETLCDFIAVLSIGFLVTCLAYVTSIWDATVMQISLSCFGSLGAPVLGLFTLAIFTPWCNSKVRKL